MSDPELVEAEACNLAELLRAQGPPSIPWTGLKSDSSIGIRQRRSAATI